MKPIEIALDIVAKVTPGISRDVLIEKLAPFFDPQLSEDNLKKRMAEAIADGLFGDALADAAQAYLRDMPSIEESEQQMIESFSLGTQQEQDLLLETSTAAVPSVLATNPLEAEEEI